MLRKMPVVPVLLVLAFPSLSHGKPAGPTNYDECILDAMRGVSSDVAARAIIDSCRSLFPGPQSEVPDAAPAPVAAESVPLDTTGARELTPDELGQLGSRAKMFGSNYRVTIDNRNPHLTLTEITIGVWDDTGVQVGRKEYSAAVEIPPQTSAEVKYAVHYRGDPAGWQWGVIGARGVAVPGSD